MSRKGTSKIRKVEPDALYSSVLVTKIINSTMKDGKRNAAEKQIYQALELIKKDFPEVRRKLWKEMFWARSYCLLTTGSAPIETIRNYIENQGR